MTKITESKVEELAIEILESQKYQYLSPNEQESERENLSEFHQISKRKSDISCLK